MEPKVAVVVVVAVAVAVAAAVDVAVAVAVVFVVAFFIDKLLNSLLIISKFSFVKSTVCEEIFLIILVFVQLLLSILFLHLLIWILSIKNTRLLYHV